MSDGTKDGRKVPVGFLLVRDEKVGDFVTPAGYRLERATLSAIRNRGGRGVHRGRPSGAGYLARVQEYARGVREDAEPGTVWVYSSACRMPDLLKSKFWDNPRFAWVAGLGGIVRLRDMDPLPALEVDKLADYPPGTFAMDPSDRRIHGFPAAQNGTHGFIKVRIERENLSGGTVPPPTVVLREKLLAQIREIYEASGSDPAETIAWAQKAPLPDIRRWLESCKAGGAA